jgi:hypothetical protein
MTGRYHPRSCSHTARQSGARTPNRFDTRRTDYANRPPDRLRITIACS